MKNIQTPVFSSQEILIMKLICAEYKSKEIAAMLNVDMNIIGRHRKKLLIKTGSKNMVGIVNYAVLQGIYKI